MPTVFWSLGVLGGVDADVDEVGCLGICFAEPLVDVTMPDGPRVFFRNVGPDEVEAIVDEAIAALKADGQDPTMRSIGAVMKPVTAEVAGRFDGKTVSEIVRSRLA